MRKAVWRSYERYRNILRCGTAEYICIATLRNFIGGIEHISNILKEGVERYFKTYFTKNCTPGVREAKL